MVIDYAGKKTPNNKPRNKLIAALILIAAFAIIALLILLTVNQRHRLRHQPQQQPPHVNKKKTPANSKNSHSQPQQHYEFYTLLPKLSTTR